MQLTKLQRLVPGLHRVARSLVDTAPKPLPAPPVLARGAGPGEPVHDPRACDELIDSVKSSLWGVVRLI